MPHLKLLEKGSHRTFRIDSVEAVAGRDPSVGIALDGEAAKTVSGRHARFYMDEGKWFVEDLGSRNGTYIGTRKLDKGNRHQLNIGDTVGLGLTGTQFVVEEAVGRTYAATMLEPAPAVPAPAKADGTVPMRRSEALAVGIHQPGGVQTRDEARVILRHIHTGGRMVGQGDRVTIGRALECLIRVEGEAATSVSRTHAEVVVAGGKAAIKDAGSRHGTFLNGKKIETVVSLSHGDLLMLGPGGPTFTVEEASVVPPGTPLPDLPQEKGAPAVHGGYQAPQRRLSREEEVFAESPTPAMAREAVKTSPNEPVKEAKDAKAPAGPATRIARASMVEGAGRTKFVREVLDDISAKNAKRNRLIAVLVVVIVGLLVTVGVLLAKVRLDRVDARVDATAGKVTQQAATLDSLRLAATQAATARTSIDSALTASAPVAVLDSLRDVLADANRRSTDFPSIARLNQGAVGLVTVSYGKDEWDGSGFVITRTGYLITNRHVVHPDGAGTTDSAVFFVTMSDHNAASRADVVMVAPADGPDIAVLKIRGYTGPAVSKLDWSGTHASQGEGAALIGFPAGYENATDKQRIVRSSMTAGNFATVGLDQIQFAGLSVAGSSGSPLFNASGEVVAVHRAGLREKPGFGFAIPLAQVVPLLPDEVRAELGLQK